VNVDDLLIEEIAFEEEDAVGDGVFLPLCRLVRGPDGDAA
jgi:hypothetical protein